MQTTTEQDICELLRGVAISCVRKRNFDVSQMKEMCPKTLEALKVGSTCSLISWCKILNQLGYDVDIQVKSNGWRNHTEGKLTVSLDDQEF